VPLSEHERRQLEQIEAALRAGDPRFAGAVRAADPRVHYRRRVVAAALGFLVGVGLLLTGVVVNVILVGVAGFVVLLVCTLWAVTSYRRMTGRAPAKDRGLGNKRLTDPDGTVLASRWATPELASSISQHRSTAAAGYGSCPARTWRSAGRTFSS